MTFETEIKNAEALRQRLIAFANLDKASGKSPSRRIDMTRIIGSGFNRQKRYEELKALINMAPGGEVKWGDIDCKIKVIDPDVLLKGIGVETEDDIRARILGELQFCRTNIARDFARDITENYGLKNKDKIDDIVMTAMFINYVTDDDYVQSDIRTVSAGIFQMKEGSKVIERKKSIIRNLILKAGFDDAFVHHVMQFNKYETGVELYGHISVSEPACTISGIIEPYFIIMPSMAMNMTSSCNRLIAIENKTTFNVLVRLFSRLGIKDTIVIYTGGYPSHSCIEVIKKVVGDNDLKSIFNFGDLDAGGFRIREFLEKKIGVNVETYAWTKENIIRYGYPKEYNNITPVKDMEKFAYASGLATEQENIGPDEFEEIENNRKKHIDLLK